MIIILMRGQKRREELDLIGRVYVSIYLLCKRMYIILSFFYQCDSMTITRGYHIDNLMDIRIHCQQGHNSFQVE
jgi:hypothetical protein